MSSSVSGTQLVFRHATERYGFRLLSRNRARDLRVSVQPPFSTRCDTRQPTEQSHYGSVPINFGWQLDTHTLNHSSFLLAVSMQPYMANGKVEFW